MTCSLGVNILVCSPFGISIYYFFNSSSYHTSKMASTMVRFTLNVRVLWNSVFIRNQPHDMLVGEGREELLKFVEIDAIFVEYHLTMCMNIVKNIEEGHEDVVMKMFLQRLKGDAHACYKSFLSPLLMDGTLSSSNLLRSGVTSNIVHFLLVEFTQFTKVRRGSLSLTFASPSFIWGFHEVYALLMKLLWFIILLNLMNLLISCLRRRTYKL